MPCGLAWEPGDQMILAFSSIWYYRAELKSMGLFDRFALNPLTLALMAIGCLALIFLAFYFRSKLRKQVWLEEMNRIRKDKPLLIKAMLVTAMIQVVTILGLWFLFMSLYPLVRLWQIVLFPAIIQIILMLPISFGGVGMREYLNLLFFSDLAGIPKDTTFAVSILGYVPILFMAFVGWAWMLFRRLRSDE